MPAYYEHFVVDNCRKTHQKIPVLLKNFALWPEKTGFPGSGNIIETGQIKIIRIEYGFSKI
jgi:hypothetical protein